MVGFAGALSLWCVVAPINSAIVSAGVVEVASHRKTIQHLEGGIVDEIFVGDGDLVTKGQPLIKIREIKPAAELAQLEGQLLETIAIIGRLVAEQNEADQVTILEEFTTSDNEPVLNNILQGQQRILESHRHLEAQRLSVFHEQTAQTEEAINGLKLQINASNIQRDLLKEELSQLAILEGKKLIPRTRILARRQELARVEGNLGAYQAEIARLKKSMSEAKLQLSETHASEILRVNKQLREERARFRDISYRITAARDILSRTTITSPIDGEVVNMKVHTANGVISAGATIMDIVPRDDELVVRAVIDPNDIDEVEVGMPADVKLTSLTRRSRMPIQGIVSDVSPDRLVDRQSGQPYYEARINFSSSVSDNERQMVLAGMGADVFIRTGERTALEYLMAPISRRIDLGLREK